MNTTTSILKLAISIAIAFTFSCSSDDGGSNSGGNSSDSGGGSSSPSGGGGTNKCTDIASCKKKQIGSKNWLAENLNINVSGSKCYGEGGKVEVDYDNYTTLSNAEIQANCAKYGRLYDWATAMALPSKCNSTRSTSDADCAIKTPHHKGICPSGWHIPSKAEWEELIDYVESKNGCSYCTGKHLKSKSGWDDYEDRETGEIIAHGNGTDTHGFSALPGGIWNRAGNYFNGVGEKGFWWSSTEDSSSEGIAWRMYQDFYSEVIADFIDDVSWIDLEKDYLFSVRCVQD